MLKNKTNSSSKNKVLSLQQLRQVNGSGGGISPDPNSWSTSSNNCGTVGGNEWSTQSSGCR